MQFRPIQNQFLRSSREISLKNAKSLDVDGCMPIPTDGVKVRWRVVVEEHSNQDAIELANRRHGGRDSVKSSTVGPPVAGLPGICRPQRARHGPPLGYPQLPSAPSAFVPAIPVAPVFPVASNPNRPSPRWPRPTPGSPGIIIPGPAPIAANPHQPRSGSHAVYFHAGWRRSRVTSVNG